MAYGHEYCCECEALTDRAGECEDSLYLYGAGPYCEDCFLAACDYWEAFD